MSEFWSCGGGSNDAVLWVPIYGRQKKLWHKFTVEPLYWIGRRASNVKWWLKWRFLKKHQYHIIRTGLEPGYYDEDTLILYGCFAMLERFVEWHEGPDALDKFSAELMTTPDPSGGIQNRQATTQREATVLYRWWKLEKPAEEKRRDELMMELYGPKRQRDDAKEKEFRALEKKIEDDEQAMLHRLIDIRRGLWT